MDQYIFLDGHVHLLINGSCSLVAHNGDFFIVGCFRISTSVQRSFISVYGHCPTRTITFFFIYIVLYSYIHQFLCFLCIVIQKFWTFWTFDNKRLTVTTENKLYIHTYIHLFEGCSSLFLYKLYRMYSEILFGMSHQQKNWIFLNIILNA